MEYDFISLGDTVTDAFIELEDAEVEKNNGLSKICMRFGDKIPYKAVHVISAVGNSANAAVSANRLGLRAALVTDLGDDHFGNEAVAALKKENLGTEFVTIHQGKKTNYHYVLMFQSERTILIKHQDYDYKMPDIGSPRFLYLSSLGEQSIPFHKEIENYLDSHPEIKLVFQPGSYQIKFGKSALSGIYARAHLFFCNKEEAQRILDVKENDIKKLLSGIAELGPEITVITDGPDGSYAFDKAKKEVWFMPMHPDPKPPIDRTGAGDSFSSTFTSAIALGLSIPEALRWGPLNSMSVVQYVGAREGLLTREKLEQYLANSADDYQPRLI